MASFCPVSFLVACLRCRHDPSALAEARRLAPTAPADWEATRRALYDEGIAALLHGAVAGRGLFPATIEAALSEAYTTTAIRNTALLYELERALAALDRAGVPVLLLKGAALAEAIYGDPALRPMADGDLLVQPADRATAQAALRLAGYEPVGEERHPGDTARYESQVALRKPGPLPTRIELHWSLLDAPYYQARLPMDWFWAGAEPLRVGDTVAAGLGPTANLLYLIVHLVLHHRATGLMWWYDIAELLHVCGRRVDWDALLVQARACDLVLPLARVLSELATRWAAAVPADVLARLAILQPSAREARMYAWLTAARRPVVQRFWADLVGLDGWMTRLRFGASHLFPAPAYMQWRYGVRWPVLLPFAYPYRWARGLVEWAAAGLTAARSHDAR